MVQIPTIEEGPGEELARMPQGSANTLPGFNARAVWDAAKETADILRKGAKQQQATANDAAVASAGTEIKTTLDEFALFASKLPSTRSVTQFVEDANGFFEEQIKAQENSVVRERIKARQSQMFAEYSMVLNSDAITRGKAEIRNAWEVRAETIRKSFDSLLSSRKAMTLGGNYMGAVTAFPRLISDTNDLMKEIQSSSMFSDDPNAGKLEAEATGRQIMSGGFDAAIADAHNSEGADLVTKISQIEMYANTVPRNLIDDFKAITSEIANLKAKAQLEVTPAINKSINQTIGRASNFKDMDEFGTELGKVETMLVTGKGLTGSALTNETTRISTQMLSKMGSNLTFSSEDDLERWVERSAKTVLDKHGFTLDEVAIKAAIKSNLLEQRKATAEDGRQAAQQRLDASAINPSDFEELWNFYANDIDLAIADLTRGEKFDTFWLPELEKWAADLTDNNNITKALSIIEAAEQLPEGNALSAKGRAIKERITTHLAAQAGLRNEATDIVSAFYSGIDIVDFAHSNGIQFSQIRSELNTLIGDMSTDDALKFGKELAVNGWVLPWHENRANDLYDMKSPEMADMLAYINNIQELKNDNLLSALRIHGDPTSTAIKDPKTLTNYVMIHAEPVERIWLGEALLADPQLEGGAHEVLQTLVTPLVKGIYPGTKTALQTEVFENGSSYMTKIRNVLGLPGDGPLTDQGLFEEVAPMLSYHIKVAAGGAGITADNSDAILTAAIDSWAKQYNASRLPAYGGVGMSVSSLQRSGMPMPVILSLKNSIAQTGTLAPPDPTAFQQFLDTAQQVAVPSSYFLYAGWRGPDSGPTGPIAVANRNLDDSTLERPYVDYRHSFWVDATELTGIDHRSPDKYTKGISGQLVIPVYEDGVSHPSGYHVFNVATGTNEITPFFDENALVSVRNDYNVHGSRLALKGDAVLLEKFYFSEMIENNDYRNHIRTTPRATFEDFLVEAAEQYKAEFNIDPTEEQLQEYINQIYVGATP